MQHVSPSEHAMILASLAEPTYSDGPLAAEELELAETYWRILPLELELVGERYTCEGGCCTSMPSSGLLTNNPQKTDKASMKHLELALATNCQRCERLHFTISEALSHHSQLLRCAGMRDVKGAEKAARARCALIQTLVEN